MKKLWGLVVLLCGVGVIVGAVAVEIAWLGLCFGTVIVGIVLLIFAADLLFLPIAFGFATGVAICAAGLALLDDDTSLHKSDQFQSIDKQEVDLLNFLQPQHAHPQVFNFLQAQRGEIVVTGGRLPIDAVTVAYVFAVIRVVNNNNWALSQCGPLVRSFFSGGEQQVEQVFNYIVTNHSVFYEHVLSLIPVVRDEMALGSGSFLVKYTNKIAEPEDKLFTFDAN